jgi:hypothetical protein
MTSWSTAITNFAECLPPGIQRWVLVCDRDHQIALAQRLSKKLPTSDFVLLGYDTADRVRALAERHLDDPAVGLLEFICCDGSRMRWRRNYQKALLRFAQWPPERVRLCFDVTDLNFRDLFSEDPRRVRTRSRALRRRLLKEERVALTSGKSSFVVQCRGAEWDVHSGLEKDDYVLPSGEVECVPRSVDGDLEVNGWIVGTIPFGMKYGRIDPPALALRFRRGEVVDMGGNHRLLRKELEMAFATHPGLRRVAELGIGQSRAVHHAARREEVGCLWHERHFGVHLGLGAGLREEPEDRRTKHHLDIVLATGRLAGAKDSTILAW